ncbi:MAG: hypothetical protein ACOYXA_12590 [Bacteroidota bacterium]
MKAAVICLMMLVSYCAQSQILFSESFNVILDTAQRVKGSVAPELRIQTQKELLVEFTNTADISIRINNSYLTLANKIETGSFGKDVFLSGGYVYAEIVNTVQKAVTTEIYGQVHWAEARGLNRRYAGGIDARFRLFHRGRSGVFAGIGPFYEFEQWTHRGVPDERLPSNPLPVDSMNVKMSTYISLKHWFFDRVFLDLSLYHQSRLDEVFYRPRLASSARLAYQISKHLQLTGTYQNIYDYQPLVPIDKWFHRLKASLAVSF